MIIAGVYFLLAGASGLNSAVSIDDLEASRMSAAYAAEVDRRLAIPEAEQRYYSRMLDASWGGVEIRTTQYAVLVDRNEFVQAAMIFLLSPGEDAWFIGASPVSTGKMGKFDHFKTPTGVFEHTPDNPDFRAEGTRNEFGVRGYGRKGMRVFDFGWQTATKGWGGGGESVMRLQMHATDPDLLERRVGSVQSKGCVRVPASLNRFIDRHGILDAAYEDALAAGDNFWVLSRTRVPTLHPGRYLVIVDSQRTHRPSWSPDPFRKAEISRLER